MVKPKCMPSQATLKALLDYEPKTGTFRWKERPSSECYTARWNRRYAGMAAGTECQGYIRIKIEGCLYFAHRIAWIYVYGHEPNEGLDHINGDPSDNRIANLRAASHSKNMQNRKKMVNGSGFSGVYKNGAKWQARITIQRDGKRHSVYLGTYSNAEEAAKASHEFRLANHPGYTGRDFRSPG